MESEADQGNGYTDREMIFFSGILLFQMYEICEKIIQLYDTGHVPVHEVDQIKERVLRAQGKQPEIGYRGILNKLLYHKYTIIPQEWVGVHILYAVLDALWMCIMKRLIFTGSKVMHVTHLQTDCCYSFPEVYMCQVSSF